MSIAQATQPAADHPVLDIAALVIFSLVIAAAAGVFRSGSIVGRQRWPSAEPFWPLALIAAGGWFLLVAGPGTLVLHPVPGADTRPIEERYPANQLLLAQIINEVSVILYLAALYYRYRRVAQFGLQAGQIPAALPRAGLGFIVAYPLIFASLLVTEMVMHHYGHDEPMIHPALQMLNNSSAPWQEATIAGFAIVLVPIGEEMFFRGCLQTLIGVAISDWTGGLSRARTRWIAVILCSLIFAALHPDWSRGAIFILALCLGYAYERTGNLWVPMLMHASFNGFEVLVDWLNNHPH